MSRPIKFRAYVPELGKMVDVFAVNPMNQTVYLSHVQLFEIPGDDVLMKYGDEPDEVKLVQCTGLKDQDGVDIYDEDILAYRDGEWSYDAVVQWDEETGRYFMSGIEPVDNFNFEDLGSNVHRVIGNIYERPHLLEPTP